MSNIRRRILLGQLTAFGDCLCASALTRQIKQDEPECHLTWAIARPCRQVAENNPFLDAIWELPFTLTEATSSGWTLFAREARRRMKRGEFDQLYLTQIPPDNFGNFDGTVRASIFNGYPRRRTVSPAPVVRLSPEEVSRVSDFALTHRLKEYSHVVLFECAALSGQSFMTPPFALAIARLVLAEVPETCVILSSSTAIRDPDPRIIDGSPLRFKENAELTKYASLFVGSYSGITWLAVSDWARQLPTIQFLRRAASVFASLRTDFRHFDLPADHIVEVTDCTPEHAASCIALALTAPFEEVRLRFHETIDVNHTFYLKTFLLPCLKRRKFAAAFLSLLRVIRRFGWRSLTRGFQGLFEGL